MNSNDLLFKETIENGHFLQTATFVFVFLNNVFNLNFIFDLFLARNM